MYSNMKEKSKIIILFSFAIVLFAVILLNNLNINSTNLIENLENMDGSFNNTSNSKCDPGCIINFKNCSTDSSGISTCDWTNPQCHFNNSNKKTSNTFNCNKFNKFNKINNINYDICNNIYNFLYNNKDVKLSDGYYMDKQGNTKWLLDRCENQMECEYNLKNNLDNQSSIDLLDNQSTIDLNNLDNASAQQSNTNGQQSNTNSQQSNATTQESNATTQESNANGQQSNNEISNSKICISTNLSNNLVNNLSNIFKNQMSSFLDPKINTGNIGSNLNNSPHAYMNLNSSTLNLADANSNHNLINDNPFSGQQPCYDKVTGNITSCPDLYYYKPPMY